MQTRGEESITWSSCFRSTNTMTSSSSCPPHNNDSHNFLFAGHRIMTPGSRKMTPPRSWLLVSTHNDTLQLLLPPVMWWHFRFYREIPIPIVIKRDSKASDNPSAQQKKILSTEQWRSVELTKAGATLQQTALQLCWRTNSTHQARQLTSPDGGMQGPVPSTSATE